MVGLLQVSSLKLLRANIGLLVKIIYSLLNWALDLLSS